MVSVRNRGKVYEYRIEISFIDGTRKWITKSGYKTKYDLRRFLPGDHVICSNITHQE